MNHHDSSQSLTTARLGVGPLIDVTTHPSIGANIQGPSVIRVPDWVEAPLGRYYMYFADHKGTYIRLAYSDEVCGPWTVYEPGSLQLADSHFPTEAPLVSDETLAHIESLYMKALGGRGLMHDIRTEVTAPHIASPDVHVDHQNERIVMYFHGLESVATQITRVATSADGITFTAQPESLDRTYLRVFEVAGTLFGLAMPGQLYRFGDSIGGPLDDVEVGPMLFEPDMRHLAVAVKTDQLRVFWTRVGDAPERVLMSIIDTRMPWTDWRNDDPIDILAPTEAWEGAAAAVEPSRRSVAYGLLNQLRDPAVFVDDERTYLFYAFGGESGIAAVELIDDPPV